MIKSGIKLTILTLLCFTLNPIDCRSQVKAPLLNFTLPKSDDHYKCVKDYVEDKIDTDYNHASAAEPLNQFVVVLKSQVLPFVPFQMSAFAVPVTRRRT